MFAVGPLQAGPSLTQVELLEGLRTVFRTVTSTEARAVATVALLILGAVFARFVVPLVIRRSRRFATERIAETRAGEAIERVFEYVPMSRPARLLIRSVQLLIAVGLGIALLVVWGQIDAAAFVLGVLVASAPTAGQIVLTGLLFFGAYVATDLLEEIVAEFGSGTDEITAHQEEIIVRVLQVGLFVFVAMAGLSVWQIDLGGLLVGAGFLGIVVGMAARQTLGSLIAGFVLMFSRPFTIGDWVEIGDEEGIVTDVTIINTRLENFDGEYVVMPNDSVANAAITNRSEKGVLRLTVEVGIDYEADVDHAVDVAMDAIRGVDVVADAPPPRVFPKSFGGSSVVLEARFWIEPPSPPLKVNAISRVVRAIKEAYDREGIKIPYPQMEVSGRAETDGFRINREHDLPAEATGPSAGEHD
ncbi:mechanosensitive ion channel family protein [Halobellus sp. EA9]|uniref:mechanosensitive ion channel family protein n=1 Tax=Halobellus sp. EA9 TaxID=3421647 RepID=UPI003EBC0366